MNIPYGPAFGIILMFFAFLKGYLSHEFSNFSNLESSKNLYEKNGFKASLTELLSLILIFTNAILIDYEPFTLFEYVFLFAMFAVLYRFLFWGITRTIQERHNNKFARS